MRGYDRQTMQRVRICLGRGMLSCAVTAVLFLGGCARHRTAGQKASAAAASTPAVYPPVSPGAVEILNRVPAGPYDKLGTVTVQENAAFPLDRTVTAIRDRAAQSGANAIVLIQQRQFTQRNEFTHRRTPMRFTVFALLRRGVPMSHAGSERPGAPSSARENPGPPPPSAGNPPAGSGAR